MTVCITFTLFLLTLEGLFRLALFLKSGPEIQRVPIVYDETYGWVLNTQMKEIHRLNRCGEPVITKPPPHPLIIKFPKYNYPKKILFVGDSITHAHEVSTGKAYYDVFEELVKDQYSVFAAGVGGYGNLQEYLIIKNLHSEIKPDIIFWQLSGNDAINNVFELERSQLNNNNQRPRPYLDIETNEIKMRDPSFWLLEHSRGFKYFYSQLFVVDWHYKLGIQDRINSLITLDPEIAADKIKLVWM